MPQVVLWLKRVRCRGEERIVCSQPTLIGVRKLISWSNPSTGPMTATDHGTTRSGGKADPWEQHR